MGLWAKAGPALYDPFLWLAERRGMAGHRRDWLSRATGQVLELGAGTGLNLAHYPPSVTHLALSEPDPGMAARLRRRAAGRADDVVVAVAPAERLPFPTAHFDTIVATLVLCTVPELTDALSEIARVLKPGGQLVFIEHIRSDDQRLAAWQDRLMPIWKRFALGCECNRDTLTALTTSGWQMVDVQHFRWTGMPAIVRPLVAGHAVRHSPTAGV